MIDNGTDILHFADVMRTLGLQVQPFEYATHIDDAGIEWRKWLRSFETMIRASRIQDDEWKCDLLLHFAGPSVQQLFETLPEMPPVEKRGPLANPAHYVPNMARYEETVAKLNSFFLPKENSTYERHLLRQMKQKAGESIDAFTVRLRLQAERCDFGDRIEENIKDQIIQNCQSPALRRDLLKKGDASLEKILSTAKVFETVAHQEKSFTASADSKPFGEEVNKINVKQTNGKRGKFSESARSECGRCGYTGHTASDEKCPAKGKSCNKCGNRDHFARKCRKRQFSRSFRNKNEADRPSSGKVAKSDDSRDSMDKSESMVKNITADDDYVFNVTTGDDGSEVQCEIGGVKATAIIDSGSKYNLMSETTWKRLKSEAVAVTNQRNETDKVFRAYGGHELPQVGAFVAKLVIGGLHEMADFYVIQGEGKVLIGRDTATAMKILKVGIIVNKVDTDGKATAVVPFGKIKGVVVDLPIKKDARPIVQPYRRIPVALETAVDARIDELMSRNCRESERTI